MRTFSLVASAAFAALLVLGACATLRGDQTVCPEHRDMRCATAPECSMDAARGCRVCQCSPAVGADSKGTLPSGVPPDRRTQ
jgi:hypothetical protein